MKCPHCGVHFDDSETRCPFCDCRVSGSKREKKDCKINTDTGFFQEEETKKKSFTQDQTFTQKFTTQKKNSPKQAKFKKQPIFTQSQNSGKGRGCVIILVVIMLIFVLTSVIVNFSYNLLDSSAAPEKSFTEECTADFVGAYSTPDGRQLALDGDNSFTLTENAATYSGYYSVSFSDADYNESYPAESYTGYSLYLSFDESGTPMPDGHDYAFYEMYVPDDHPDTLIVCNYEDEEADLAFTRLDSAA